MKTNEPDVLINVYKAANWLGFELPASRPDTKEERERARKKSRAFYNAVKAGRAPQPDAHEPMRWRVSTILNHIDLITANKPKRGRKMKATTRAESEARNE